MIRNSSLSADRGIRHRAGRLVLDALVDEQRGVAAVVEDHVRALAVRPGQRLLGAPPVLLERLALPGEDRDAGLGDRRGGVVLGREDVARAQRTSAPSATSVSISTAVWIVMCSEPVMRAPLSGCASANSARVAIRPGISCSASSISLRPKSARRDVGDLVVGRRRWRSWVSMQASVGGVRRRRAGAGASPAPSAASRRTGTSLGTLGLAPRARRPWRRAARSSLRSRSAKARSERPMSCSSSSSRRVRRRCSSAGP